MNATLDTRIVYVLKTAQTSILDIVTRFFDTLFALVRSNQPGKGVWFLYFYLFFSEDLFEDANIKVK